MTHRRCQETWMVLNEQGLEKICVTGVTMSDRRFCNKLIADPITSGQFGG